MNFGLTRFATFTIINNNIDVNSDTIKDNILSTIEAEYITVYNELLLYRDDDKFVADYMKGEWKEQLAKDMINIIFNRELTKEQRIYNITNKLGINIAKYSNYINNKYIEK